LFHHYGVEGLVMLALLEAFPSGRIVVLLDNFGDLRLSVG
jgi:hypothetical protein